MKPCTYVTVFFTFDLDSEVSSKEVLAFHRLVS